jgi:hypothetical protein
MRILTRQLIGEFVEASSFLVGETHVNTRRRRPRAGHGSDREVEPRNVVAP